MVGRVAFIAGSMLLIAATLLGCGPKAEDSMLYLCDGSLSVQDAERAVRDASMAKEHGDAAGVDAHVAEARADLKVAEDRLETLRAVAPGGYGDWVDGLEAAVDATRDAIAATVDGAGTAVISAALAAADAGRAAMGPAAGCAVESPAPSR